jgi:predicted DNA-binding transcriptional regulator AlpA
MDDASGRRTYNARDFAALLGVSPSTLYPSVKDGTCPVDPIHVGSRLVWSKAAANSLLGVEVQP